MNLQVARFLIVSKASTIVFENTSNDVSSNTSQSLRSQSMEQLSLPGDEFGLLQPMGPIDTLISDVQRIRSLFSITSISLSEIGPAPVAVLCLVMQMLCLGCVVN